MIIVATMTDWKPPRLPARIFVNPRLAQAEESLAAAAPGVVDEAGFARAAAEIKAWPGYEPTPLRRLPGLARQLGVGSIAYKDEGGRFGLGAFKAVGGAYAVLTYVAQQAVESYHWLSPQNMIEAQHQGDCGADDAPEHDVVHDAFHGFMHAGPNQALSSLLSCAGS